MNNDKAIRLLAFGWIMNAVATIALAINLARQ